MPSSFRTESGIVVPAVSTAQMREVDRIATDETGPNLVQMMENAGRNLALQCIEMLGAGWQHAEIVVLAGRGGNGGGGICAARHLANRAACVRLVLADRAGLSEVSRFQYEIFQSTPGSEVDADDLASLRADIVIDAVIGYSLHSAPAGRARDLIDWANEAGPPILSLDVPSGVDATTGESPGAFARARATMTLALPKVGLLPERTGELVLADLGIPSAVYDRLGVAYTPPFGDRFRVALVANE